MSQRRCDCAPTSGRIECAYRALGLSDRICARQAVEIDHKAATPRESFAKLSRIARENFANHSRAIGGIRRDQVEPRGRRWRHDERRR